MLAAAREPFAEAEESTALEEVARRAGIGIGTLYRHFPNRQALLEGLYVNEVEEVCRSAAQLDDGDPWQALGDWFQRLIGYLATKRALAHELLNYLDEDAALFKECRASLFAAGEPLLKRAQDAGAVRSDVDFSQVMHMVVGVSKIPGDPGQIELRARRRIIWRFWRRLDASDATPSPSRTTSTIVARGRRQPRPATRQFHHLILLRTLILRIALDGLRHQPPV